MAIHDPTKRDHVAFVRFARRVYRPLGFTKGYNFILYFILAGAFLGFNLARLPYLSITGYYASHAAPAEWYWMSQRWYTTGIGLHLCCVVPAGLLCILQFVPAIRHKALLFHRLNGYTCIILLCIGTVGALMIARRSFGGSVSTQGVVGLLGIMVVGSLGLALYNIKRLQIDQHRAWMLRCWVYCGGVVTARLILILSAVILGKIGTYYAVFPCEQIVFSAGQSVADSYPSCRMDPKGMTVVHAQFIGARSLMEVAAAMNLTFGMAVWLALAIHAFGVEVYLHLTPAEGERLRQVSYEKQLERGLHPVGSAGLTVDRLGDCEVWKPRRNNEGGCTKEASNETTMKNALPIAAASSISSIDVSKSPSAVLGWDRSLQEVGSECDHIHYYLNER